MSPLLSGRQAYARLNQFLDTCVPEGAGSLTERILQVEGLRKGLCFLISDCYEEDGIGTALDNLRYRGQECAVIQPLSPFELDPALDGAVKLTDPEDGEPVNLLADREALENYGKALEQFLREIRETCFRRETPYVLLDAGKNFENGHPGSCGQQTSSASAEKSAAAGTVPGGAGAGFIADAAEPDGQSGFPDRADFRSVRQHADCQ